MFGVSKLLSSIKEFNVSIPCRGDHLSTTYTHVLWSTRARHEHLRETKYFSCICSRCADPTELGSHLGSLKCPCGKGWMTPEQPLQPDSDWSCDQCPGMLSSSEVLQLTDRLSEEVDAAMSVADKSIMSDLLFRLVNKFCMSFCWLKRVKNSIYSFACGRTMNRMSGLQAGSLRRLPERWIVDGLSPPQVQSYAIAAPNGAPVGSP
ncbi:hypothetical protein QAD02_016089 [Eretmocerus hayati]|uniref:Uncharacterized protein n=1 Tax=Eretmocerus hayati TaxID=131215 RepID=A0ACC2PAG6_9HYME|nr:hypothetical protein QAD02_016089 [Eretmocerus hayati]